VYKEEEKTCKSNLLFRTEEAVVHASVVPLVEPAGSIDDLPNRKSGHEAEAIKSITGERIHLISDLISVLCRGRFTLPFLQASIFLRH
jgi:hypothetical protein